MQNARPIFAVNSEISEPSGKDPTTPKALDVIAIEEALNQDLDCLASGSEFESLAAAAAVASSTVSFGDDVRRLHLGRSCSFADLDSTVANMFASPGTAPPPALHFHWTDEDGDVINIKTDVDLENAVATFEERGGAHVPVRLFCKSRSLGEQHAGANADMDAGAAAAAATVEGLPVTVLASSTTTTATTATTATAVANDAGGADSNTGSFHLGSVELTPPPPAVTRAACKGVTPAGPLWKDGPSKVRFHFKLEVGSSITIDPDHLTRVFGVPNNVADQVDPDLVGIKSITFDHATVDGRHDVGLVVSRGSTTAEVVTRSLSFQSGSRKVESVHAVVSPSGGFLPTDLILEPESVVGLGLNLDAGASSSAGVRNDGNIDLLHGTYDDAVEQAKEHGCCLAPKAQLGLKLRTIALHSNSERSATVHAAFTVHLARTPLRKEMFAGRVGVNQGGSREDNDKPEASVDV
eukprot:gene10334-23678_t